MDAPLLPKSADAAGSHPVAPARRQWRAHLSMTDPSPTAHAPPDADALAAWIEAIAATQDRAAFAALFRHFAPRIKAYLMRGGAPDGVAEDLTQDAMVAVWRKAAQFDRGKARASTWIFTIARNLRIDQLRRGTESVAAQASPAGADDSGPDAWRPAAGLPGLDDLPDPAPAVADALHQARAETDLRSALSRLPEEQREILRLSFFEDQPHAAIAQALALPLGTVKSRIRLAVGHLRRQLGHLLP